VNLLGGSHLRHKSQHRRNHGDDMQQPTHDDSRTNIKGSLGTLAQRAFGGPNTPNMRNQPATFPFQRVAWPSYGRTASQALRRTQRWQPFLRWQAAATNWKAKVSFPNPRGRGQGCLTLVRCRRQAAHRVRQYCFSSEMFKWATKLGANREIAACFADAVTD
jgi:hypothetical protein